MEDKLPRIAWRNLEGLEVRGPYRKLSEEQLRALRRDLELIARSRRLSEANLGSARLD